MIIYPAIDLYEGQCVRLYKGAYDQMEIVDPNPVDRAKKFEDEGFTHLHLVDLKGARGQVDPAYEILERISSSTNLKVDFSGGLRNLTSIERAFESGADAVTIGSFGVSNPEVIGQVIAQFSASKVILALDSRDGKVAVNGWEKQVSVDIRTVLQWYDSYGLTRVMSTDISRDGTGTGIREAYYRELISDYPQVEWIVSGGVAGIGDVELADQLGAAGLIIGKALYAETVVIEELKPWLK